MLPFRKKSKRKKIEERIRKHNKNVCENCTREDNCDDCREIETRSVSDVMDDLGDAEYHRRKDEGEL